MRECLDGMSSERSDCKVEWVPNPAQEPTIRDRGTARSEAPARGSLSSREMVVRRAWSSMNAQQLRHWLLQQAGDIRRFTDYEIVLESHHELMATLGTSWFSDVGWNEPSTASSRSARMVPAA